MLGSVTITRSAEEETFGAGTVFGAGAFHAEIPELVNGLLAVTYASNPFAAIVACERRASDLEFDLSCDGVLTGLDLAGADPDDIRVFWKVAANFGAASVLRLVAERCAQHGMLTAPEAGHA